MKLDKVNILSVDLTEEASSMVTHFIWYRVSNILQVGFKSGDTYQYENVTPEIVDSIINGDSFGKAFNEHIKNKCTYRKL